MNEWGQSFRCQNALDAEQTVRFGLISAVTSMLLADMDQSLLDLLPRHPNHDIHFSAHTLIREPLGSNVSQC
jgi:hypothetical protein